MRKEHIVIIILAVLLVSLSLAWIIGSPSSEPFIHLQLLENEPPANIPANSSTDGWILNWTPAADGYC